jgi:hypothetical protein
MLLVAYHLQRHFVFLQFLWWMLENREPYFLHCSKTSDGTTVKSIHEMGITLYWSSITSGKVHYGGDGLCHQMEEARALHFNTTVVMTQFLYECILTKFRCPLIVV